MNDTYKNEVSIYKDYKPTLVKDAHKHILNFRCLSSRPQYQLLYDHTCTVIISIHTTLFHYRLYTHRKQGVYSESTYIHRKKLFAGIISHSSAAIFKRYSLSILKSLQPSSVDRSEAPLLL